MLQDTIGEFHPNSMDSHKGHIPTMEEMLARMHAQENIGRKALPVDHELTQIQLLNESSNEIPLTSVNNTMNEEMNPTVEDDLLNLSGLPNVEYFEAGEDSLENLENLETSPNKTKLDYGSGLADSIDRQKGIENWIAMSTGSIEGSIDNETTKAPSFFRSSTLPPTTPTTSRSSSLSTKLFKSIDNFGKLHSESLIVLVADNKIIQRDEIDLRAFNSYNKPITKISNSNDLTFDPDQESRRLISDCNDKAPLNSDEVSFLCAVKPIYRLLLVSKSFCKKTNGLMKDPVMLNSAVSNCELFYRYAYLNIFKLY